MKQLLPVYRRRARRLVLTIALCAGVVGATTPRAIHAQRALDITTAYMATDDDCNAAVAGTIAQPPPQTAFPSGQVTVCLAIVGSLQDSDQLTAAIYDSQGRVAWSTGPGTVRSQFGTSQATGFLYPGLQTSLATIGHWPDGAYHTTVNFNGPVAQSFDWSVGTVPPTNTPIATPIIVGDTNTPVPPSATPVPPTATPVPPSATPVPPTATRVPPTSTASATPRGNSSNTTPATPGKTPPPKPGTAFSGKGFKAQVPATWKKSAMKDGASTFVSPDKKVEVLARVFAVDHKLTLADAKKIVASFTSVFKEKPTIVYHTIRIGPLSGTTAALLAVAEDQVLIVDVVSDSHRALLVATLIGPKTPKLDVQTATKIVQSIRLS